MEDSSASEDEEILLLLLLLRRRRRHLRAASRKTWTRRWIMRRHGQGAYCNLIQEWNAEDPETFRQFHRLDRQSFEDILARVGPLITKEDTRMRLAISASERLAVTLRFLATAYAACRSGFSARGNKWNACYNIPHIMAAWKDAQTMCMMQNAYLADINSRAEHQLVVNLGKTVPGVSHIWLGSRKSLPSFNQWRWVHNGNPMSYQPWATGEPSGDGLCLSLLGNMNFKFNDDNCARTDIHFVCKYYDECDINVHVMFAPTLCISLSLLS